MCASQFAPEVADQIIAEFLRILIVAKRIAFEILPRPVLVFVEQPAFSRHLIQEQRFSAIQQGQIYFGLK